MFTSSGVSWGLIARANGVRSQYFHRQLILTGQNCSGQVRGGGPLINFESKKNIKKTFKMKILKDPSSTVKRSHPLRVRIGDKGG